MIYQLSVDSFNSTFAVNENGTHLNHNSGKRYKLFPFVSTQISDDKPIVDLQKIVGRFINRIQGKDAVPISADDLITKLKTDDNTTIDLGMEEIFDQVVRHMFFDKEGNIRPINLWSLAQIPCDESSECKLADYLVDVLGDSIQLKTFITNAESKLAQQSNALEKFAASKFESKLYIRKAGDEYQRITNAVKDRFEADFEYILGARNRTRDYLIPLLEFYYFSYTSQAALQLIRFLDGEREHCIPLYFCLEWEKTSQNRRCFTEGWNLLQNAVDKIFAHAVVLEILNQREAESEPVDYIMLQELVNSAPGEDHRIAEEIRVLTDRYRYAISDCAEMQELKRVDHPTEETAAEVKYLFDSVKCQFENTGRERRYSSYAAKFKEYSKKFLKNVAEAV